MAGFSETMQRKTRVLNKEAKPPPSFLDLGLGVLDHGSTKRKLRCLKTGCAQEAIVFKLSNAR